jgi:hypothetical protein
MPFAATGGVPPYVFSVVPGGAGGTIDSSTGLYTSPQKYGEDTVEVTDSTAATSEQTVFINGPELLLLDIVKKFMGLSEMQARLYSQKAFVPTDDNLYVIVHSQTPKPYGNSRSYGVVNGVYSCIQSVNMQQLMIVEVLSRSLQALAQKELVVMAFNSDYAERQMELNSIKIAPLSTGFTAINIVEGPALPYRFQLTVNVLYATSVVTPVGYYDTFLQPQVFTE